MLPQDLSENECPVQWEYIPNYPPNDKFSDMQQGWVRDVNFLRYHLHFLGEATFSENVTATSQSKSFSFEKVVQIKRKGKYILTLFNVTISFKTSFKSF